MNFVCIKSGVKELRGYVFRDGLPTEVTDPGTLSILSKDPYFRKVNEEKEQEAPEAQVLAPCPFCSREFTLRGPRTMHIKACQKVNV
jgi:hypothetical protein